MSESFLEALRRHDADADTIEQAARYYLAERLDDLPPDEMREELHEAGDPAEVERIVTALAQDEHSIENAALLVLSDAWDLPEQRERVERALSAAKGKLPVIEVGILAIVVMYGMYLRTTGGIKRAKTTVQRNSQGELKMTRETELAGPGSPLAAITKLFGP